MTVASAGRVRGKWQRVAAQFGRALGRLGRPAAWMGITVVCAYRVVLRPMLAGGCRFHPSCSEYAIEAFRVHGALHGAGLAVRRLLRCRPWGPSGYDPVPPAACRET